MPEMEKVIKALTLCIADGYCNDCPYEEGCFDEKSHMPFGEEMMRDALALLKEQTEIVRCKDCRHSGFCNTEDVHRCTNPDGWFCADGKRKDQPDV